MSSGPGEIVGVGRAQEAEAVLQHLDHAGAGDLDVAGGQLLQDGEHQLLLAHGAGVLDLELLGEAQQLRRRFGLEILQLHFLHALLLQDGEWVTLVFRMPRGERAGFKGRGKDKASAGRQSVRACSSSG